MVNYTGNILLHRKTSLKIFFLFKINMHEILNSITVKIRKNHYLFRFFNRSSRLGIHPTNILDQKNSDLETVLDHQNELKVKTKEHL